MQRRAACAPLDGDAGEREWERSAEAEEGRGGETADGADRKHRGALVRLERESLPHSDEPDDR